MNGVFLYLGALCALCCAVSAAAETVSGPARLVDGDTLEISRDMVRLSGIDAPETRQRCTTDGRDYACGDRAADALGRLISGQQVRCTGKERDRYDRLIGQCSAGGTDLNREMVRLGWAVAFRRYSEMYLDEELEAAKANRGLWRGTFVRPSAFREARWQSAEQSSPKGCPIKGNISQRGQIYHTPWSRHYARTRINTARGERWFCSEAEALAAGWRAPLR